MLLLHKDTVLPRYLLVTLNVQIHPTAEAGGARYSLSVGMQG